MESPLSAEIPAPVRTTTRMAQSYQPVTRRGARDVKCALRWGRQSVMIDLDTTSDVVAFEGDWRGPVVATSVHAGHGLRPEIAEAMVLD